MKYAFIVTQVGQYPVSLMCRVLEVSRSGYYAAQKRAPSERAQADARLQSEITIICDASRQR